VGCAVPSRELGRSTRYDRGRSTPAASACAILTYDVVQMFSDFIDECRAQMAQTVTIDAPRRVEAQSLL